MAVNPQKQAAKERTKKPLELQDYIASLLFLDPASGSGNFLTETYISEPEIVSRLFDMYAKLTQEAGT